MIRRDRPPKPPRTMPTNPKPVLKVTQLPVFRVHYTVLEDYIRQVFGFEYDLLLASGITEGQCLDCDIKGELGSLALEQRAADLRLGNRTKSIILILTVLAHDGYIPVGRYIISTHPLPAPITVYTDLLHKTQDPQSPECQKFRKQHKQDKEFQRRANLLNTLWNAREAES